MGPLRIEGGRENLRQPVGLVTSDTYVPTTPPTQAGIKLTFAMYHHGGGANVSNLYHFNGGAWADQAEFEEVADALVAAFRPALSPAASLVGAVGYNPNSFLPVYDKAYSGAGTFSPTSGRVLLPSDCAAVLRFTTTQRTSKNHPIYLFKYMKPCYNRPDTAVENVADTYVTALNTFGSALVTGFATSNAERKYCGPRGAVAQSRQVLEYVSHRDFVD